MDAYRFVVAFRREKPTDRSLGVAWRGWVERVYPPTEEGGPVRQWFQEVREVSPLIAGMIDGKEDPDGSTD